MIMFPSCHWYLSLCEEPRKKIFFCKKVFFFTFLLWHFIFKELFLFSTNFDDCYLCRIVQQVHRQTKKVFFFSFSFCLFQKCFSTFVALQRAESLSWTYVLFFDSNKRFFCQNNSKYTWRRQINDFLLNCVKFKAARVKNTNKTTSFYILHPLKMFLFLCVRQLKTGMVLI